MPKKQSKKEFIIVRKNGKVVSMREKSKDFGVVQARRKFIDEGTLTQGRKEIVLEKVKEITEYGKKPRVPKTSYQAVATVKLHGQDVNARSDKRKWASFKQARENALQNLYGIVAVSETGESDKERGEQLANEAGNIRVGIVYYIPR